MDIFAPCNFANIQGYPHDVPQMDKLPIFKEMMQLVLNLTCLLSLTGGIDLQLQIIISMM